VIDVSWIFRRKDDQIVIIVVCFAIVFIPYMIQIPLLEATANKLILIGSIINASALVLGLYGATRRASTFIQNRTRGWFIHVYMLFMLALMIIFGLYGTNSVPYNWMQEAVIKPLGSVNYSLLAFYLASSGARAMRARSAKASVLLIAGGIVFLQQAPFTAALFPAIDPMGIFLSDSMATSVGRMFLMATTIGGIVMGVRILTGKETTFLGQTGDK
jgi:hypothetical protein